ncbi:ribonuclease D [Haloechinothrix sp. YIM 98757]|uniref:Ribonuclease D n=1 Tax=Haloechinothrix aidingensis TaxID=2752311 RepID=A0A838AAB0_9PSEU|nr:ribonuclease D [Haloechinothrix aidingensis]
MSTAKDDTVADGPADTARSEGLTALTEPAEGTPPVVEDRAGLQRACDAVAAGTGPVAIDTERASGYRYWQRAYLVQVRRDGSGTHLIDPVALDGALDPLATVLAGTEWVLHAASQDLPCLAELDLRPAALFDTELAARLAGFPRVGLGTLVEQLLGFQLAKGHGAADWSTRPLPRSWLDYAALDVELLLPLRRSLIEVLDRDGKLAWAEEEFDAVRQAPAPAPRSEPWRRTSGIHKVRTRRGLAVVRELWNARDAQARKRDRAPGRVLPDKAIIAAAQEIPGSVEELVALPGFGGQHQRRHAGTWLRRINLARTSGEHELPLLTRNGSDPPPPNKWGDRDPDAAARLTAARAALTEMAERHELPVENLVQPDLVRKLCWEPPADIGVDGTATALRAGGARPWQVSLTTEPLSRALGTSAT